MHSTDNPESFHTYGLCLVRLKKYQQAIKIFDNIVKKYHSYSDAWYSLGRTYLILDDVSNAIRCLNVAKKYNPNDYSVFFYLGLCYEKSNKIEKAIEHYLLSLELKDDHATHINLGLCYCDVGELILAYKHTKRAFEMKTDDLDCLRYYVYILIKMNKREEAYKLLLENRLDYSKDCTILEILILLALDMNDFDISDTAFYKLKKLDKEHSTVRDYEMLKNVSLDRDGDVFQY